MITGKINRKKVYKYHVCTSVPENRCIRIYKLIQNKTKAAATKILHQELQKPNTTEKETEYINYLLEKWRYGI